MFFDYISGCIAFENPPNSTPIVNTEKVLSGKSSVNLWEGQGPSSYMKEGRLSGSKAN